MASSDHYELFAKPPFHAALKHLSWVNRPAVQILGMGNAQPGQSSPLDQYFQRWAAEHGLFVLVLEETHSDGSTWRSSLLSKVPRLTKEEMVACRAGDDERWVD